MKYAVLIGSGMSDRPVLDDNNVTPLSSADKPCMDSLVKGAEIGLTKTAEITELPIIEKSVLSLFGYDAKQFFTGISPFYSAGRGIIPQKNDVVFRCSLVTLSGEELYEEKTMLSDNADSISQCEFDEIFRIVSEKLNNDIFKFVRGEDNHLFLIWKNGEPYAGTFTAPRTALSQCIGEYLPKGDFVPPIYEIMRKSYDILKGYSSHALWIWGEGRNPQLETFKNKFGLNGTVITNVDFVQGIGTLAGMKICPNIANIPDTALREWKNGQDIVFVYTDSIWQYSLGGDFDGKKKAIHDFDKNIVQPLTDGLKKSGEDFGIMIVSDLAMPVCLKRYSGEPVPYMIYKSNTENNSGVSRFDENTAADSDYYIPKSFELINRLILQP